VEVGAVAEVGEDVALVGEGRLADPGTPSPPMWEKVAVLRFIQVAM
jgi:hypothetical protein